jgi:hypothetical protein
LIAWRFAAFLFSLALSLEVMYLRSTADENTRRPV